MKMKTEGQFELKSDEEELSFSMFRSRLLPIQAWKKDLIITVCFELYNGTNMDNHYQNGWSLE
jgi:hypothetical protein